MLMSSKHGCSRQANRNVRHFVRMSFVFGEEQMSKTLRRISRLVVAGLKPPGDWCDRYHIVFLAHSLKITKVIGSLMQNDTEFKPPI